MYAPRKLARLAGGSYLVIFFAAIFANFFVLEALLADPLGTVGQHPLSVRLGILAFLITVVFDVVVAWALYELYKTHALSGLSTLFRMMHAAVMAVAVYALPEVLDLASADAILRQVNRFNTIWPIGLFFFGIHLVLLARILDAPKWLAVFLTAAGVMYMADTTARFLWADYEAYEAVFLALVAIPSIAGELWLAVWLLARGGKV